MSRTNFFGWLEREPVVFSFSLGGRKYSEACSFEFFFEYLLQYDLRAGYFSFFLTDDKTPVVLGPAPASVSTT